MFRDCPTNWDYEKHPKAHTVATRCYELLVLLGTAKIDVNRVSLDTRNPHGRTFSEVTPDGLAYFAGHYRGEEYRCLKYYYVEVPGDTRVGVPPDGVSRDLSLLADVIRTGFGYLDKACALPDAVLPKQLKVYYLVTFAARVFVEFLRIHPFANGNGHMARFLVWMILVKYKLVPRKWPLDDRPPDPPYSVLISLYRDGNREPLESFILQCVIG
jgi:hypothetical protein